MDKLNIIVPIGIEIRVPLKDIVEMIAGRLHQKYLVITAKYLKILELAAVRQRV